MLRLGSLTPDDLTPMDGSTEQIVAVAVALLAGSELLALFPNVKANSWIQLALGILRGIVSTKTPPKR